MEGEDGQLVTCCMREDDERVREATEAEGGYDCEACPVRQARDGLTLDDRLALDIYNVLAPVAELGLAPLVFQAFGLSMEPDEVLGLTRRLGHLHAFSHEQAMKRAKENAKQESGGGSGGSAGAGRSGGMPE